MIITIDGPAGSGKSTAARNLAKALGIAYLDTGATYRAVTLKALREGIDLQDERALAAAAGRAKITLIPTEEETRVLLDGVDVTAEIRSPEVSDKSHYIARSPAVRQILIALQRRLGKALGSFVAEGRDQGTVVFPEADVKFYLDAAPEVRARRRQQELTQRGEQAEYAQTLEAITTRDRRDTNRTAGPLRIPDGAIVVNTSGNTIEQTRDQLLRHLEGRV